MNSKRSPSVSKLLPGIEVNIIKAEYLDGYRIKFYFDDGYVNVVNFEPFLVKNNHPMVQPFKKILNFKKFVIEHGQLMWGDYEMIFPLEDYYSKKVIR